MPASILIYRRLDFEIYSTRELVLVNPPVLLHFPQSLSVASALLGAPSPDHDIRSRIEDAGLASAAWEEREVRRQRDTCSAEVDWRFNAARGEA